MGATVRALRGATTLDEDTPEQMTERVVVLLEQLFERNGIDHGDLVSVIFTATPDVVSMFPAAAARTAGLGDVPLLCAQELAIEGSTPRCIRVLVHAETERSRDDLHHVYLEGARSLRDDLPA
ncbi:MAG: chorismate mutase [Actinomycetota bacterium]